MERVSARYQQVVKALDILKGDIAALEAISEDDENHDRFRRAAIKSLEFSIDTFWKFIKDYIETSYELAVPTAQGISPRAAFRTAFEIGFLSDQGYDLLSNVIAARNLTSHTYNEETA